MSRKLLDYIVLKKHHQFRKDYPELNRLCDEFKAQGLSPKERMTRRFELLTHLETPVLLPNERIAWMRTVKRIPDCFTEDEWAEIKKTHYIHELGYTLVSSKNQKNFNFLTKSAVLAFFCKFEFSMIKYSVLWAGMATFWLSCLIVI